MLDGILLTLYSKERLTVLNWLTVLNVNLRHFTMISDWISFINFIASIIQTTVSGATLLPIFMNGSAVGEGER